MLSYLHVWERYVADWGGMESRTYANHYGTKKRLTTSTKNSPPLLKEPESRKAVYSCLGVIVVSPLKNENNSFTDIGTMISSTL